MREQFQMEPYPLNEERICAFLMLKKDQGKRFQTFILFINTFSWFFRQHYLDNIVLTIAFKAFKNGLRRMMLGATAPNQKLPFPAEFVPLLHEHMNLQAREDRLLYFLMALAFNCFMRIGEVLQLRVKDVQLHDEEELLSLFFRKSKADQFAQGNCGSDIWQKGLSFRLKKWPTQN